VFVIGGSAGGFQAVTTILGTLPRDLRAFIGVVLHRSADRESFLAQLLSRATRLGVVEPHDGQLLHERIVYVAPRDLHMRFTRDRIRLDHGPREHHARPAIDPLFVSAAESFGPRVCGVVLTGGLSDGAHGLIRIKIAGGLAIVQDPYGARAPSMPAAAIARDDVDAVLGVDEIGPALARVSRGETLDGARRRAA
jgi:two-component system chemotaxis response regulator CheB